MLEDFVEWVSLIIVLHKQHTKTTIYDFYVSVKFLHQVEKITHRGTGQKSPEKKTAGQKPPDKKPPIMKKILQSYYHKNGYHWMKIAWWGLFTNDRLCATMEWLHIKYIHIAKNIYMYKNTGIKKQSK